MLKTSYSNYFEFIDFVKKYKTKIGGSNKLTYAFDKIIRLNKHIQEDYQNEINDLRVDFCEKDKTEEKKGHLLHDESGNYVWSAEGTKLLNKAVIELSRNKEISINTYSQEITEDFKLTELEQEIFRPFLALND